MLLKDNAVNFCVVIRNFRPRGLGLGNLGVGVLLYTISKFLFGYESAAIVGFVCLFIILGMTLMLIYIMSFFVDPHRFYRQELSNLEGIARVCTLSMAISLLGKLLSQVNEFQLPIELSIGIVSIGAILQFFAMMHFIRTWYYSSAETIEPYFHNGIHSCVMTSICLPGDSIIPFLIRSFGLALGLILLLPNVSYITFSVLTRPSKVANSPLVALTQAAGSLTCSGWFSSPLVGDISDSNSIGGIIGHFLFAFSTLGFILTMFAIWQRRQLLWNFGENPAWAGSTFPFVNTAIAATLYRRAHPELHFALTIWALLLSILAFSIVIGVDILYVKKWFFTSREYNPLDGSEDPLSFWPAAAINISRKLSRHQAMRCPVVARTSPSSKLSLEIDNSNFDFYEPSVPSIAHVSQVDDESSIWKL